MRDEPEPPDRPGQEQVLVGRRGKVAALILLTAFAGIIRAAIGALSERDPTSPTPPAPVDLAKISNDRAIEVINANPDIPEVNRMAPGPGKNP